jgi:hypothetical protein
MRKQRYDNEALYPCNGPVVIKGRRRRNGSKRGELIIRRPVQLRMQSKAA